MNLGADGKSHRQIITICTLAMLRYVHVLIVTEQSTIGVDAGRYGVCLYLLERVKYRAL